MRMNMEMSATNVSALLDLSTYILVSVATLDIDWFIQMCLPELKI